jgi:plasmid stability protein
MIALQFAIFEVLSCFAFCAYNDHMQYTIRNVPSPLDAALRRCAREQGKSLNDVAIEALARGAGLSERRRQRDLTDIAGSWQKDPAFDSALAAQDTIDPKLWL